MSLLVNRNRFGIGLIDTTKSAFYGWGVKGATQAHLPPRTRSGHFNPRAREGRDIRRHASGIFPMRFNPRAREGRDSELKLVSSQYDKFQSTRPQGARRPIRATST